jgi:hypothetical protein
MDEGAGKETERWNKREEDKEEDQISPNGTDKIDEAKDAHADHEIGWHNH